MTIAEALAAIDALRPNMFTQAEKLGWLSACDGMIWEEILKRRQRPAWPGPAHPGPNPLDEDGHWHPVPPSPPPEDEEPWTGEDDSFTGYTSVTRTVTDPETGEETEEPITLLVPYPYDRDVYTFYLMMMVDQANGEIEKYNQSSKLYNNALLNYRNYVNRERAPVRNGGTARFWW